MGSKTPLIERGIRVVNKIFNKHNIPYWLEAGSLIGIIRENRVLPWDIDGDVSFPEKYAPRISLLRKEFKQYGFILVGNYSFGLCYEKEHIVCIIPAKIKNGLVVKKTIPRFLRFIRCYPNPILSFLTRYTNELRLVRGTTEMTFPLQKKYVKSLGIYVSIPNKPEEYLSVGFKDWRTIKKYGANKFHPQGGHGTQYKDWIK